MNLNLKNGWLESDREVFIVEELSSENEVISIIRADYLPKFDTYQYYKIGGEETSGEILKEVKKRLDETREKIKDSGKLIEI